MHGSAVLPGEHPVRVLVVALEEGSFGTLLGPPLGEEIRRGAVDREQPKSIAGLAVAVLSPAVYDDPSGGLDGKSACLEVYRRPMQSAQLGSAQSRRRREHVCRVEAITRSCLEESAQLCRRPDRRRS